MKLFLRELVDSVMNSLRARLVFLTITAVALGWLVTAVMTWQAAHHELAELLWDHPIDQRQEIAEEIAEHMIKPLIIALPILALLLALAVGIALRPLKRLTSDIARRAPDRLDPLALDNTPTEAVPLVRRLNELFSEITRVLEKERRFTADAAHELRTPLAAISAQAQVAARARDENEREHALNQLALGAQRAAHLVEQLLTLARIDDGQALPSGSAQACALDQLLIDVAAHYGAEAIDRHIELEVVEGTCRTIQGDPTLLRVLLRNLIDNALRYTPAGGRVELSVQQTPGGTLLSVRDSGPGIASDQRSNALQRFVRLAGQEIAGSGLGLAIVQRIAEVHGARIELLEGLPNSAGGHGLAVTLDFPVQR
jgi:signal transduction histidine kinase